MLLLSADSRPPRAATDLHSRDGALEAPSASESARAGRAALHLVLVVVASALLGGLTSFAQGFLPDPLRPFANSASGWTLLTALIVGRLRARTALSALAGASSFAALVLGYQVVSGLRGNSTDETLFLIIGLIVGPFIGVAASWLGRGGRRAVVGCGVLAGVALGEGTFGLLLLAEWTGWFYWTLIGVAGLLLLASTMIRTLRTARTRIAAVVLTAAVAAAFFGAYSAVSGYVPDRTDAGAHGTVDSSPTRIAAAPLAG